MYGRSGYAICQADVEGLVPTPGIVLAHSAPVEEHLHIRGAACARQGVLQLLPEALLDQHVHGSLHDTAEVSCVAPVAHV